MRRLSLCILWSLSACGSGEVLEVVLDFPSEAAFVRSEQAEIQVFGPGVRCTDLLVGTSRQSVRYSTGTLPLCAFFERDPQTRVVVDEDGDFAVLASASAAEPREILLQGCREYRGGRQLVVTLAPTPLGRERLGDPTTCDAAAHCRGECEP